MSILPTFKTDRLILREINLEDASSIFETYAQNPNVAQYVSWYPHQSVEDTKKVIQNLFLKGYKDNVPGPWGIILKEKPDQVIGTVGCLWSQQGNSILELGYALAEEYWGQGITAEACRSILPYVFETYKPAKIIACYNDHNPASGRVMEKVGMKFIHRCEEVRKDKLVTMIYYSLQNVDLK